MLKSSKQKDNYSISILFEELNICKKSKFKRKVQSSNELYYLFPITCFEFFLMNVLELKIKLLYLFFPGLKPIK